MCFPLGKDLQRARKWMTVSDLVFDFLNHTWYPTVLSNTFTLKRMNSLITLDCFDQFHQVNQNRNHWEPVENRSKLQCCQLEECHIDYNNYHWGDIILSSRKRTTSFMLHKVPSFKDVYTVKK